MPLETIWRLMLRVNDAKAANRCLKRILKILQADVMEEPKPYWKIPELWEVSLRSSFILPPAAGVYELLCTANHLASDWLVSGPTVKDRQLSVFEGVFDAKSGRPHIVGLTWASFSVGQMAMKQITF